MCAGFCISHSPILHHGSWQETCYGLLVQCMFETRGNKGFLSKNFGSTESAAVKVLSGQSYVFMQHMTQYGVTAHVF